MIAKPNKYQRYYEHELNHEENCVVPSFGPASMCVARVVERRVPRKDREKIKRRNE